MRASTNTLVSVGNYRIIISVFQYDKNENKFLGVE